MFRPVSPEGALNEESKVYPPGSYKSPGVSVVKSSFEEVPIPSGPPAEKPQPKE